MKKLWKTRGCASREEPKGQRVANKVVRNNHHRQEAPDLQSLVRGVPDLIKEIYRVY